MRENLRAKDERDLDAKMTDPDFQYAVRRAAEGRSSLTEMAQLCKVSFVKFKRLVELYRERRKRI